MAKRVLYNTCAADPWLKVAKKLKEEQDFEPVYWIGYDNDNSEVLVSQIFPEATYHPWLDAWKGIFPEEIEKSFMEGNGYIDIDFLRAAAPYEVQIYKMMDRIESLPGSFSFTERQRHYFRLIKYWTICLDLYKPDLVISAIMPHRIYDYVLYMICKFKKIPFILFQYSFAPGRTFAVDDIFSIGDFLDEDYIEQKKVENHIDDLPLDVSTEYRRLHANYSEAKPYYMAPFNEMDVKWSSWHRILPVVAKNKLKHLFDKDYRYHSKYKAMHYKHEKQTLEESCFSLFEKYKIKKTSLAIQKQLKKEYDRLTDSIDLNVPYIVFFPHYQPEATTSPGGDIFVNQQLCVESLLKNTPEDVLVYVKEHPHQYMGHTEGFRGRTDQFYRDLKENKRVRLVPFELNSFELMKNAKAVSTVTGTVGWEAIVQGKPVIIFGSIWYERYSGALRITDQESASRIEEFIENFKYEENELLAYLFAFAKHSIRAYHYLGFEKLCDVSEDECVNNIVDHLLLKYNGISDLKK